MLLPQLQRTIGYERAYQEISQFIGQFYLYRCRYPEAADFVVDIITIVGLLSLGEKSWILVERLETSNNKSYGMPKAGSSHNDGRCIKAAYNELELWLSSG